MAFEQAYESIYQYGMRNVVRGQRVREDRDVHIDEYSKTFPHRAGANPAIGFVEGLQFIAGTAELAPIRAVAPKARLDLFGLSSYYGPRTAAQFPRIIEELNANIGTRRAVLLVAHPDDSPETVPCTLSIQFHKPGNNSTTLYVTVTMRSSDMVWGLPYDIIQFGMVSYAVAKCVGLHDYALEITAGNMHIYEETAVHPSEWDRMHFGFPTTFLTWNGWVQWARSFVYRDELLQRGEVLNLFRVQGSKRKTPEGGDAAVKS